MFSSRPLSLIVLFALSAAPVLRAHDVPAGEMKGDAEVARAAAEMIDAANSLIACLTDEQQKKMLFDFKDAEREKFIFIPKERKGLPLKEMTLFQRPLGYALLNTGLSQHGFAGVLSIMSLEQVLNDSEKGKGPKRDSELYYIEIFGKPGADQIWAWRFEGHHFSASFTCVMGKTVIAAPLFMGCNPEVVKDGPRKGHHTLIEVEIAGRKLVDSLDEKQRKKAIIADKAPEDILTTTKRHAELKKEGIAASELTVAQKMLLLNVIKEYVGRERPELAAQDLARIEKDGVDNIAFAWSGPVEVGNKHYYRIQNDSFMIEYDNFQNDGNHIHSVWRDLKNDYGEDILKRHYAEVEHK